jgi:hypothetical protein
MNPRKPDQDDSPTGELEAVEYDGTQTVQLDDTYRFHVVYESEGGTGGGDPAKRGPAQWKRELDASTADSAAATLDELKALDADLELAISQKIQALERREVDGNPSDTPSPKKPK